MKVDLHSHTNYSFDGVTDVRTYVKVASQRLGAIAITDHDTMKGWEAIKGLGEKFTVIPGMEVKTTLGDIIGVFLSEEVKSREPLQVIDEIKSQGGISILPHPLDVHRGFGNIDLVMRKIDCIEVFNARCAFAFENSKALELAKGANKGMAAGSDAHTPGEIGRAYVETASSDIEGLRKEMVSGRAAIKGKLSPLTVHVSSSLAKLGLR